MAASKVWKSSKSRTRIILRLDPILLLETRNVTKELLHALLRPWSLPSTDQNDRAWIQRIATLARLRDSLPAEATLILEIICVDLGHTI